MNELKSFHQGFHSISLQLFTEQSAHVKCYVKGQGIVHASRLVRDINKNQWDKPLKDVRNIYKDQLIMRESIRFGRNDSFSGRLWRMTNKCIWGIKRNECSYQLHIEHILLFGHSEFFF